MRITNITLVFHQIHPCELDRDEKQQKIMDRHLFKMLLFSYSQYRIFFNNLYTLGQLFFYLIKKFNYDNKNFESLINKVFIFILYSELNIMI